MTASPHNAFSLTLKVENGAPFPPGLEDITELDLSIHEYDAPPVGLFRSKKLQRLKLQGHLTTLTDGIGQLKELRELRIDAWRVQQLPPSIGELAKLEVLDLTCNVAELPDAIKNLPLTELVIALEHYAPLRLPDWIWELARLRKLCVTHPGEGSRFDGASQLRALEELRLTHGKLTATPAGLATLPKLRVLDLTGNALTSFPTELCRDAAPLEELYLAGNPITALSPALAQLSRLRVLNVSGQKLEALPDAIGSLEHLEHLAADHNLLTGLPATIGALRKLSKLALNDNKISSLPASFFDLTALRELRLEQNKLAALPADLARLANLEILYVQNNPATRGQQNKAGKALVAALARARSGLPSVPPARPQTPPRVASARASESSPSDLGELLRSDDVASVKLGLSMADGGGVPAPLLPLLLALGRSHADAKVRKQASTLFDAFAPAALKLRVLETLGKNSLTEGGRDDKPNKIYAALSAEAGFDVGAFALEVFRLAKLGSTWLLTRGGASAREVLRARLNVDDQSLELDTTNIALAALPEEVGELSELRSIQFHGGSLRALPSSFLQLASLESLVLSSHKFREIPDAVFQLPRLRVLDLAHNQALAKLPSRLKELTRLEQLLLSSCKLTRLPTEIGDLRALVELSLSHNKKLIVPESLGKLGKLERLHLRACDITELPASFWKLTALRELDLAHNELGELSPDIAQLTQLETLDLSFNTWTSTLPSTFARLTKLETLTLYGPHIENLVEIVRLLPSLRTLSVDVSLYDASALKRAAPRMQLG